MNVMNVMNIAWGYFVLACTSRANYVRFSATALETRNTKLETASTVNKVNKVNVVNVGERYKRVTFTTYPDESKGAVNVVNVVRGFLHRRARGVPNSSKVSLAHEVDTPK
jgi:hypothetical protein